MDYKEFTKRIDIISHRINEIGGSVSNTVYSGPATKEQVEDLEKKLGITLPKSFKKVLLEFSSELDYYWFFPNDFELEDEFAGIFSGSIHWGLESIEESYEEEKSWIEEYYPDLNNEEHKVWHNKLIFYAVGNGDFIGIDLESDDGAIYYLSHENDKGHGYKLGDNFIDFIEKWSRICFVGGEDWQWLPFTTSRENGILPDSKPANKFRDLLKIDL